MSSSASARSRPKVRHQRVPRTHSCDHPRFIQLVNELARINDVKKKQEEAECDNSNPSGEESHPSNNPDKKESCSFNITHPADSNPPSVSNLGTSYTCTDIGSNSQPSIICCGVASSRTSNGYQPSATCNQSSTSALHDSYYQQHNTNHHQQHHSFNPHHHHHTTSHHNNYDEYLVNNNLNPQQQHLSSNTMHPHHGDRCPRRNALPTNYSYEKQGLTQQNSDSGLRQDENRSKRKRSSTDTLTLKKSASACGNLSGSSKRLKSSPDIRPLSPSFTKCPICLLDSMERDPSFTNTCFHLFCYSCIENWTKNKATCPLCRTKFTKIIYNIKSATNYEEKPANPIRRDDDDSYIADRLMLEHLHTLNTNAPVYNRASNHEEVQFLFENLRNPELVGNAHYYANQIDHRQAEAALHPFNAVANNFNINVPHPPFTTSTSYPITASNYIALLPNRLAPATSTAITSAYTSNHGLPNDANSRGRTSRNDRSVFARVHPGSAAPVGSSDISSRTTRGPAAPNADPLSVTLERNHHHHPPQMHGHHHHHAVHHQGHPSHHHQQLRSTIDMSARAHLRLEQAHSRAVQMPYQFNRHYHQAAYAGRLTNNPHVDHQHLLESLYRQMPDM